jgi:hypothetical protein
MKKFTILGATAILFSLLAGPVVANPAAIHPAYPVCDRRDPGNPYSERFEWSAFRSRGSYDTRAEWTCQPVPSVAYQRGWLQDY